MDAINFLRYLAALLFVFALAGTALLVKRYGRNPAAFRDGLKLKIGKWDFAAPDRRLAIVETLAIGPRQKLFIVRRDNVEHLIFSGPEGVCLVEGGIAPAAKPVTA